LGIAARVLNTVTALCMGIAIEPLTHKPGCVSRLRDVGDKRLIHFHLCSYACTARGLAKAFEIAERGLRDGDVGEIVEHVVTRVIESGSNVCLGSIILLAPLIVGEILNAIDGVGQEPRLLCSRAHRVVKEVCGSLDTLRILRSIAKALPSYVSPEPPCPAPSVLEIRGFEEMPRFWSVVEACHSVDTVLEAIYRGYEPCLAALEFLEKRIELYRDWDRSVVDTFLYICSRAKDHTLAKRVGPEFAESVREMCREALELSDRGDEEGLRAALAELDRELVSRGVAPGSVADLCAVTISLHLYRSPFTLPAPSR